MSGNGRGCCLSVGTSNSNGFHIFTNQPKNLRPFQKRKTTTLEKGTYRMRKRNGWCINYEVNPQRMRFSIIIFVANIHAFFRQCICQHSLGLVIPKYFDAPFIKISGNGTHTDTTYTNKINIF